VGTCEERSVEMPSGSSLPVVVVHSEKPGPTLVVTGNVHGDETTGIGVVHNLIRRLPTLLYCGKVVLYPTLNPAGLMAGIRTLPGDGQDLNRMFPGKPRGPASERHAHAIWADIQSHEPDGLLDQHTDVAGAIPYAIVDRVVRLREPRRLSTQCLRLAGASGLTVLREYPRDRYLRYGLDRSLPGAMVNLLGVPSVTLEVGPRRRLDPKYAGIATAAALGFLTAAGVVDAPAPVHKTTQEGGPWRRDGGPRTNHTGILVPLVRPGQNLERGSAIAEVRTIRGEVLETLRARSLGFVVALPERTHVVPGVACATIAVRDR
jgi:predicted deacylase